MENNNVNAEELELRWAVEKTIGRIGGARTKKVG